MVTSPPPNTYLHMHIPHGPLTFLQHLAKEQPHSAVEDWDIKIQMLKNLL